MLFNDKFIKCLEYLKKKLYIYKYYKLINFVNNVIFIFYFELFSRIFRHIGEIFSGIVPISNFCLVGCDVRSPGSLENGVEGPAAEWPSSISCLVFIMNIRRVTRLIRIIKINI